MLDAIAAAALAAERAIGSIENGADVEWLVHEGRPWLVQARPLPAAVAAPRPRPPGDVFGFAALDASRHWVLDIAHNPEPLSPAQQGLVELVVDGIGAELALACGYLYQVDRAATPPTGEPREIAVELERVFFEEVEPALDRELVILEAGAPSLEPALDRFVAGAREYRRIAAALSAARHASAGLEPALQPRIGAGLCRALAADSRLSPAARERADRLARGGEAAFFAPHAPIWDVAAATYGEEPERLAQMVAALEQRRRRTNRGGQGERQLLADLGAAVGEIDDRLYYRAQRLVRRALLATGGDDLVWIGLETARAMARGALVRGVAEQAAAARELYRRQRELSMPRAVRGGVWEWQPFTSGAALRGAGRGGRARGPAARSRPRPGDIWCTADLTPGDALAATAAAGIALEHGTLLGHGAAMAQELGIPVVVQIPGLCARIREGEPLFIDGDAGLLLRL
jgi:pyruvate,water dikinase